MKLTKTKAEVDKILKKYQLGYTFYSTDINYPFLIQTYKKFYNPTNIEDKCSSKEIIAFTIVKNRNYNCLAFVTKDKTTVVPKSNLRKRPPPQTFIGDKSQVTSAFRYAIENQVKPYRVKGYDVDHVYPFSAIRDDFMKLHNLQYNNVPLQFKLRPKRFVIANKTILSKWRIYHKEKFEPEVVTHEENMKRWQQYRQSLLTNQ